MLQTTFAGVDHPAHRQVMQVPCQDCSVMKCDPKSPIWARPSKSSVPLQTGIMAPYVNQMISVDVKGIESTA